MVHLRLRLMETGALINFGRRLGRWLTSPGFRIALGIGLLGLLLVKIDLGAMTAAIKGVRLDLFGLLTTTVVVTRLIGAFRWYVLLRGTSLDVSYLGVVRLTFVSDFMGYLTPGTLGVEALRFYGMSRMTSDPALSATSMLVERMLALFALIVLVLGGLAFRMPGVPPQIGSLAWLGLVLLLAVIIGLMASPIRIGTLWLLSHPRLSRAATAARNVYRSLDRYRARPGLLAGTFVIALVFQLMRCATIAVGAAAFGVDLPFLAFVVIVPVVILITLLPISIAGLGVREVGFVYLFGQVGMPAEVALPLALLTRALAILMALPGMWFYVRRGVVA
jgi:glycosyltransferase 2 family protein